MKIKVLLIFVLVAISVKTVNAAPRNIVLESSVSASCTTPTDPLTRAITQKYS